jgi:hypothetical protein
VAPSFLEHLWTSLHINFCNELHTHRLAHNLGSYEKNLYPSIIQTNGKDGEDKQNVYIPIVAGEKSLLFVECCFCHGNPGFNPM